MYNGNYTPLQVLVMKELFELLERTIDRCRDVGNAILHCVQEPVVGGEP